MAIDVQETARSAVPTRTLPPGKVQCFISKTIVDEAETVEIEYGGVRVRIHRRYVAQPSDPAAIP